MAKINSYCIIMAILLQGIPIEFRSQAGVIIMRALHFIYRILQKMAQLLIRYKSQLGLRNHMKVHTRQL